MPNSGAADLGLLLDLSLNFASQFCVYQLKNKQTCVTRLFHYFVCSYYPLKDKVFFFLLFSFVDFTNFFLFNREPSIRGKSWLLYLSKSRLLISIGLGTFGIMLKSEEISPTCWLIFSRFFSCEYLFVVLLIQPLRICRCFEYLSFFSRCVLELEL